MRNTRGFSYLQALKSFSLSRSSASELHFAIWVLTSQPCLLTAHRVAHCATINHRFTHGYALEQLRNSQSVLGIQMSPGTKGLKQLNEIKTFKNPLCLQYYSITPASLPT